MATLPGALLAGPLGGSENPNISANLRAYTGPLWPPPMVTDMGLASGATLTRAEPVTVAPRNLAGSVSRGYSDDYYHRVHVLGGPIGAGNIATEQVYYRTLWNAFLVPRTLGSVSAPESVSVYPAATTLLGTEQRTFTITIAAEGPPKVAGRIVFNWDSGVVSQGITVSATRVLPWTWSPDWSAGMLERLEWKTDVLELADGNEQRRDLRLGARRTYEFNVAAVGTERLRLEAVLWRSGTDGWAMPLWHAARRLTASLPADSGAIPMDTADTDFRPGGDVMLLADDPRVYESLTIAEVTPTHLLLANNTTQAWGAGARVVPTRAARLTGAQRLRRFTGDSVYPFRVQFELLDPWDGVDGTVPLYRGAPVVEVRPDWSSEPELELSRQLEELDAQVGGWLVRDRTGRPVVQQKLQLTFATPGERAQWLALLSVLRGRLRQCWVPTWADDFTVAQPATALSSSLVVEWSGYSEQLAGQEGRRDIRIQLRSGTVLYRRILSAAELSPTLEQLELDAALGVSFQPDEVALVSFMMPARNASDAAELSHWDTDVSRATATFRSIPE